MNSLEGAASNFLQDLFTGKDVLESIVAIGESFGEIDAETFEALIETVLGDA